MRFRPQRYQCPKCRWEFAFRKKRCCPGCGTLLLIASDNPTDAELTELKSFWMWEPFQDKWDYIRDWEEHKREAMRKVKPLGGGSWRLEGLALLLPVVIRNFNWCPPTGVSNGRAADRESE